MSKDIFLFPLSTCPANIALVGGRKDSTWTGRKGETRVDEYLQEAGVESHGILGHLGFELRTFRPTRRGSSSDMIAQFSAPRASQRCQLTGDRFARGMLGNSSLLSAVTESRETALWPELHLSDFTLCWQRTALKA